jgi:hypothetical protein
LDGEDNEDGAPLSKAHARLEEYACEYFTAQTEDTGPSYAAWFDMGAVAYVERTALSEFFNSRTAPRRSRPTNTTTPTCSSSSVSSSTTRWEQILLSQAPRSHNIDLPKHAPGDTRPAVHRPLPCRPRQAARAAVPASGLAPNGPHPGRWLRLRDANCIASVFTRRSPGARTPGAGHQEKPKVQYSV